MSQRFFIETPIADATTATLTGDEAHHLAKVMRAKPGMEVTLLDGNGWEFTGRVAEVGKAAVQVDVIGRRLVDRERSQPLTLAVALPKGDRQKFLAEKLVELGVTRLVPIKTQRGVAEATPSALARLRRQVIEASKQCGRNRLMKIADPLSIEALLKAPPNERRLLAHPSGGRLEPQISSGPTLAAVGPEGGFTDDEVRLAVQSGWEIVSLGPRILRIETAAIAIAAMTAG